jgi:hypothetical protein
MKVIIPSLRDGFYVGLGIALLLGIFLLWLWQPERQVAKHTEHLFRAIEQKDWTGVTEFIAADYRDQWGDDRVLVLERMREVLRYVRGLRITAPDAVVHTDHRRAVWVAKITMTGEAGELTAAIQERVNSLRTPFELEWRRNSAKPWDWKLVRVGNPSLEIPAGFE